MTETSKILVALLVGLPMTAVSLTTAFAQEEKSVEPEIPFKLRKSFDEVTVFIKEKNFVADDPATISLTYDGITENTAIAAKGALIYPIKYINTQEAATSSNAILARTAFAVGVEFDFYNQNGSSNDEREYLAVHNSTQFEISGGGIFDGQYLSIDGMWGGDFATDSNLANLDIDYVPVNIDLGLNTIQYLSKYLGYRTKAIGTFRTGYVFDEGTNDALKDQEYVKVGADLGLDILFSEEYYQGVWLKASVDYKFYQNIGKSDDFSDLLVASLSYYPRKSKNFGLVFSYSKGVTDFVERDIDLFSVNLGLKF